MQSSALKQGPIDRSMRVAKAQVHTVLGPVVGHLSGIDRDAALGLFAEVSSRAVRAASTDHSHRWAQAGTTAPTGPEAEPSSASAAEPPAPPVAAPPAPPVAVLPPDEQPRQE